MTDTEIVFKIRAETDQLSMKLKKAEADVKRLQKQMLKTKEVKTAVDQTTRSFATLAAHIAKIVAIYATFEGLNTAVQAMADFEQKMKEVGVVSGATTDEFILLTAKAKSLGETTQFSATQVADAMKQMAMSGMQVNDIYVSIDDVLNLAAATMTDLGDTAQIVTTIMNAYQLQASDANDVTDALAKTTTNSATTLDELGRAFAKVGPVANQLGVSVEETAALLGVLADNGRRGAEAGTQLKIVMERLASNSEAKKALDTIGVSAYDSTGKLKNMTQIIEEVKEGLKKLHNTAKANQIASVIFGEEAKSSAIALMNNLDKVGVKLKEIQLAMQHDFAGSAAKEMMDTLSGSWKKFKSALEGVALTIGENLIPALRDAIDDFTKFLGELDPNVLREFGTAIGNLAKSLEKAIVFVIDFAARIIAFGEDFPGVTAAVSNFVAAVAALLTLRSVATFLKGSLGPAVEYLGKTFATIAGMVMAGGPLMVGLAALAAILATLYTRQQMLNESYRDATRVMSTMSTQYGNVIDILQTVHDEINKYGAAQKSTVEKAKKAIESLLPAYKKEIEALEKRYDLNEAQLETLNVLRSNYGQLQLRLEKLGKVKTFENLAAGTKALSDGIQLTKEQLAEAQKVSDKFYAAYSTGVASANTALNTLIQREIALKTKLGELANAKVKIEQDAAVARLDVNKSINDQIFNLYLSGMSKYDKLVAEGAHKEQTLREAEFNFEKALTAGRIDLAKKYAGEYANVISTLSEKEFFAIAQGEDRHKTFTQYKIELLNKARDLQIKAINAEEDAAKKANDEKMLLAKKQLEAVEIQIKSTKILISVMEKLYESFVDKHLFNTELAKADVAEIKTMTAELNADMKNIGIDIKTDDAIAKAKKAGVDIEKIISEKGSQGVIKPKIDVNSIVNDMVAASEKAVVKTNEELDNVLFKLKFIPDKEKFDAKVQELIELTRKKKAGLAVDADLAEAEKALQTFVEEAEKDEITVDYNMKTLNEYIEQSADKLGAFHPNVTPDVTFDDEAAVNGVVSLIDQIKVRGPVVDIPAELTSQDDFKQAVTDLLVLYKDQVLGIPVEPEKIAEAEGKVKAFVNKASEEKIAPGLDPSIVIEKVKSTAEWISTVDPELTLYADDSMVKMAQANAEKPLGTVLKVGVDDRGPRLARQQLSKPVKAVNKIDADVKKPKVERDKLAKPVNAVNKIDVEADKPEFKREELSRPLDATLIVDVDDTEASLTLEELKKSVSTTLTIKVDAEEAEAKIKELKKPTSSNHHVRIDASEALRTIATLKEPTSSYHYVRIDATNALNVIARLKQPTSSTHTIYVREVHLRAAGGSIYKRTGRVPGYDPTDSDKVPAMLTAGEFVVRRKAVDKYGAAFLHRLNNMELPKYAKGGSVGEKFSQYAKDTANFARWKKGGIQLSKDELRRIAEELGGVIAKQINQYLTTASIMDSADKNFGKYFDKTISNFSKGTTKQIVKSLLFKKWSETKSVGDVKQYFKESVELVGKYFDGTLDNVTIDTISKVRETMKDSMFAGSLEEDYQASLRAQQSKDKKALLTLMQKFSSSDVKKQLLSQYDSDGIKAAEEYSNNYSELLLMVEGRKKINVDEVNKLTDYFKNDNVVSPLVEKLKSMIHTKTDEEKMVDSYNDAVPNKDQFVVKSMQQEMNELWGKDKALQTWSTFVKQTVPLLEKFAKGLSLTLDELKTLSETAPSSLRSKFSKAYTLEEKLENSQNLSGKQFNAIIDENARGLSKADKQFVIEILKDKYPGLIHRAGGGSIPGYDPTDSDKVPAMLTAGEFVVQRKAVDKYGAAFLNMVNSMQLPKFADGGAVSSTANFSPVPMRPIQLNIGNRSFETMAPADVAASLERYLMTEGGL